VVSSGMQFATSGYLIKGDAITLAAGVNIIRVGGGNPEGADFVATIASELKGSGGIDKSDLGTLALTGANSYTGGTMITNGTLQLGDGGAAGSIVGDVVDNGTLAFNRSDEFTFAGAISGNGSVNQIGAGTTILTSADNTYSGATNVVSGTLRAGGVDTFSPNSTVSVAGGATLDLNGLHQTVAGLNNAGVVAMGSDTVPNTVLTVTGDYAGQGGTIIMNTVLGDDNAPTDKLVVNGNTSGSTNLHIVNAGGLGAQTTGNGIEVVRVSGASNGRFELAGAVAAGAYDYNLFQNGVAADAADGNWYLRSSGLRPEVPVDAATPELAAHIGLTMLGTFFHRNSATQFFGNNLETDKAQPADIRYGRRMWARVFGERGSWGSGTINGGLDNGGAAGGKLGSDGVTGGKIDSGGPAYDFSFSGVQTGIDFYRAGRDNAGFYISAGQMNATIQGLTGGDAGKASMDSYAFGGYWTHRDPVGWYTDLVLQTTWYENIDTITFGGQTLSTNGFGFAASGEAGYRIALGSGYDIAPQGQLIYQRISIDDAADAFSRIKFGDSNEMYGRLGCRLAKGWETKMNNAMTAWVETNIWRRFDSDTDTTFANLQGENPTTVTASLGETWAQLGIGLSGQVTPNVIVFVNGNYNLALSQDGHSFGGHIGLKVSW